MKALAITAFDTPPALRDDLRAPTPGPTDVLVRVHASSANPADNSIAAGVLKQMGVEYEFPVTLGRDYAGVVDQIGADVTRYAVGDEVFGFVMHANPTVRDGSWAELIVVPDTSIAPAARGVDATVAGAAPLAGIAAMTAINALALSEGETLLIVGATGGVGSFAVQLAARAGAAVVAPALPEDEVYLRELGVSELLPRDGDLAGAARGRHPDGFDALLDLVSFTPDAALLKTAAASPHPSEQPATAQAAPTSWPYRRPRTCNGSPACWPTAYACPFTPPTSSRRPPTRSTRSQPPTPRARSPSASSNTLVALGHLWGTRPKCAPSSTQTKLRH
jgi:NADPH2:quinone reductase